MGVLDDLLRARERFDGWSDIQQTALQRKDDPRIEAEQANARTRFLRPDDPAFAERVFEASDLMPVRYLALGQWAARPVGRIHLRSTGEGDAFATGFLVAPGLLLTNWHVLKSRDHAAAARVVFDAEDDVDGRPRPAQEFALDPDAAFVADPRLDFCFVGVRDRSSGGVALSRYGYLRLYEATGKVMRGEYATIIQHPHGRQKHIALRENRIDVYVYDAEAGKAAPENDYLYYRTDTAQGSSGAPVLNDQWYVIALHRRGVPKTRKQLREGVRRKAGRKPRPADYEDVVLRRDGTPAREGDPDSIIAYVANEGVRVSRILRRLDTLGKLRDADAEHAKAIATRVRSVAKDLSLGPFERPTATRAAGPRRMPRDANGEALELVRRDLDRFPAIGELGYDPDFLGIRVPLPVPRPELRRELAMRLDDPTKYLLEFRHFTTCMHARRRLPVFAAANLGTRRQARHPAQEPPAVERRPAHRRRPPARRFDLLVHAPARPPCRARHRALGQDRQRALGGRPPQLHPDQRLPAARQVQQQRRRMVEGRTRDRGITRDRRQSQPVLGPGVPGGRPGLRRPAQRGFGGERRHRHPDSDAVLDDHRLG